MKFSRAIMPTVSVFLGLLANPTHCQNPSLTPRDIFFKKDPIEVIQQSGVPGQEASNSSASPDPLVVRYKLLRKVAGGVFVGVDPDSALFRAGDEVRLSIELNRTAYMYVIQCGSSGRWSVLFPSPKLNQENRLGPRQPFHLPGVSAKGFGFDGRPGEERIFLIFAHRPDVEPETMVGALNRELEGAPPSPKPSEPFRSVTQVALGRVAGGLRARDILIQTVDEPGPEEVKDVSLYAANRKFEDETPVVVCIRLQHR